MSCECELKMERVALIAVLLLGVITSVDALICLTCSSSPGVGLDDDCINGETTRTLPSLRYPLCVTFGEFDSNKSLLQIARLPYYEKTNPFMDNEGCYESTDLDGNMIYVIACTCDSNSCNDFIIDNCRCEKPIIKPASDDGFSIHGVNALYMGVILIALIVFLFIIGLFVSLLVIRRSQTPRSYFRFPNPKHDTSDCKPPPYVLPEPQKTGIIDTKPPFVIATS